MILLFSVLLAIATLLYFIALYCTKDQLTTAIDVVDAAADFLAGTKRMIAVSFGYFIVTGIIVIVWIIACVCILSMGNITANPNGVPGIYTP